MAASFPLRRLSQKELSNVLFCMQTIDRLSYSLCSQKCKKQIVSLNLRATDLTLEVGREFCISTEFADYSSVEVETNELQQDPILNLNASRSFNVTHYPPIDLNAVEAGLGMPQLPNPFALPQNMEEGEDIFGNPPEANPNMENPENGGGVVGDANAPHINLLELLGNHENRPVEENQEEQGVENEDQEDFQAWIHEQQFLEHGSFWNYDLFSAQDWLRHYLNIYHRKSINRITFEHRALGFEQFIGIMERLEIENLDIFMSRLQEHTQGILDRRLSFKHLTIFLDSLNMPEILRKILLENLGHVTVQGGLFEEEVPPRVTLDDILLANTSRLHLNVFHYSGKELNRLVKSWIRGACKRLEVLYVVLLNPVNADIVLRGIPRTEITRQDLIAKMNTYNYNQGPVYLIGDEGGFSIRGKDGREATVVVSNVDMMPSFHLLIWN